MLQLMLFPFLLTVMEFNSESRLDDVGPMVLPDAFQDQFVDIVLYEAYISLLTSSNVQMDSKMIIAKICGRLPAARKTIATEPQILQHHISFCLTAFRTILSIDLGDREAQSEEMLDMAARLFRIYSITDLCQPPTAAPYAGFLEGLEILLKKIYAGHFSVGSSQAELASQAVTTLLTHAVKHEDQGVGQLIMRVLQAYADRFFQDADSCSLEDRLLNAADSADLRSAVEASFRSLEESYHFLDAAKPILLEQVVGQFLGRLEVWIVDPGVHAESGVPQRPRGVRADVQPAGPLRPAGGQRGLVISEQRRRRRGLRRLLWLHGSPGCNAQQRVPRRGRGATAQQAAVRLRPDRGAHRPRTTRARRRCRLLSIGTRNR